MSSSEIYQWWFLWLGIAGVIVIAAAALLLTIIVLARRIAALAGTALGVVEQIEQNTKPIWQLNATNKVAHDLAGGSAAIDANLKSIVDALGAPRQRRVA